MVLLTNGQWPSSPAWAGWGWWPTSPSWQSSSSSALSEGHYAALLNLVNLNSKMLLYFNMIVVFLAAFFLWILPLPPNLYEPYFTFMNISPPVPRWVFGLEMTHWASPEGLRWWMGSDRKCILWPINISYMAVFKSVLNTTLHYSYKGISSKQMLEKSKLFMIKLRFQQKHQVEPGSYIPPSPGGLC